MARISFRRKNSAALLGIFTVSAVVALLAGLRSALSEAFVGGFSAERGEVAKASEASRRQWLANSLAGGVAITAGFAGDASAELFAPKLPESKGFKPMSAAELKALQDEMGDNIGRIAYLKNGCWETGPAGKIATVSTDTVIVWDPDAPCGEGMSFIHAAGRGNFAPMTAAAGPTTHTYYAATFEFPLVKDYKEKVGQCFTTPTQYENAISWEVASIERGGRCK